MADTGRHRISFFNESILNSSEAASLCGSCEEPCQEKISKLSTFCESLCKVKKSCVLITSGGTRVPLERNAVRFIENFSTGMRGAKSAEYFLESGFAVVFLHSRKSARPWLWQFDFESFCQKMTSNKTSCTSDQEKSVSEVVSDSVGGATATTSEASSSEATESSPEQTNGTSVAKDADSGTEAVEMVSTKIDLNTYALEKLAEYKSSTLYLEYDDLDEYLFLLRRCCEYLNGSFPTCVLYLAAAVSDFYIPFRQMHEDKIESGSSLDLHLEPVPKFLGAIKMAWAPKAFVIGFKLETNFQVLRLKAERSLRQYKLDLVIANELATRYERVYFCTQNDFAMVSTVSDGAQHQEPIEKLIVAKVVELVVSPTLR